MSSAAAKGPNEKKEQANAFLARSSDVTFAVRNERLGARARRSVIRRTERVRAKESVEPRKETEGILLRGRKMGDSTGCARRGTARHGEVDIVDYEIGSGYGPLNDAERRNAPCPNAARRDDGGVCNGGRLHAMDKRFAYTLKITGLTRARDCRVRALPPAFTLFRLFCLSLSFPLSRRLPEIYAL